MADETLRLRHIDHVVWKPLDWYPESADQYPDRLPNVRKPEITRVLFDAGSIEVEGHQLAGHLTLRVLAEGKSELFIEPGRPPSAPKSVPRTVLFEMEIPAAQVRQVVEALLYVHRRTREHEYEGENGDVTLPESGA